jgi:hypothetical protein
MFIQVKSYEVAPAGQYHAVLADIIDLGSVTSTFQNQTKTYPAARFVWILNALGKDGKPLQVAKKYNITSLHEKSNIYKDLKQILGTPPLPTLDIESLIGQTRYLWVSNETTPDGTKTYTKIMGILPAQIGPNNQPVVVPIPSDFVRDKFKPKTTAGPNGQPAQTYSQPPQQAQPVYQAQQPYNPPQQFNPAPAPQGADVKF